MGVCDARSDECVAQAWRIGKGCDDGDACTTSTVCTNDGGEGVCAGGTPNLDAYEPDDAVGAASAGRGIDDCGNGTGRVPATISSVGDVDWYKFTVDNSSPLCDFGTRVELTAPAGQDYDLLVCVSESGQFHASCAQGTQATAPAGLQAYSCCASTTGAGQTDSVRIDWGCTSTLCIDGRGTVYVRATPAAGQAPECVSGYDLSWRDD